MSIETVIMIGKFIGTAMSVKTAVEGLKEGNLLKAAIGGFGAYMGVRGLTGAGTDTLAGKAAAVSDAGAAAAKELSTAAGADSIASDIAGAMAETGNQAFDASLSGVAGDAMKTTIGSLDNMAGAYEISGGLSGGLTDGLGGVLGEGSNLLSGTESSFLETAGDSLLGSAAGGSKGLLGGNLMTEAPKDMTLTEKFMRDKFGDEAGGLLYENGNTIMDVGGKVLSGYSDAKKREEELKFIKDERDLQRQREDEARRRRGAVASIPGMADYMLQHAGNLWGRTSPALAR